MGRIAPTRALFNVDYLFLGTICIFLRGRIVFAVFMIVSFLDCFVFISSLYHFTPKDLILSFWYANYSPLGISSLPFGNIIGMAAFIGAGAFLAAAAAKTRSLFVPVLTGPCLCILAAADIYNGTNTYPLFTNLPFYGRTQYVAVNVANSGLLAADIKSFLPNPHPSAVHVDSASQIGLRQWQMLRKNTVPNANMALILVESWGEFEGQDALNRAIAAPLLDRRISDRYHIDYGSVRFKGSTTNAELRELCDIYASYRDIDRISSLRCLPKIFESQGYRSTGFHGFYGDMFNRTYWWPLIGISHGSFLENMGSIASKRKCGTAFPGICDTDLIRTMADTLRNGRQFSYALTINSHLPLPPATRFDGILDCTKLPIVLTKVRCALAQHWRRVFNSVADNASRSDIMPTVFVIVGDHSPPLMVSGDHNFSSNRVPYIILSPRIKAQVR